MQGSRIVWSRIVRDRGSRSEMSGRDVDREDGSVEECKVTEGVWRWPGFVKLIVVCPVGVRWAL